MEATEFNYWVTTSQELLLLPVSINSFASTTLICSAV